jgi:acetolactate synthase-1/2/3 large subunit
MVSDAPITGTRHDLWVDQVSQFVTDWRQSHEVVLSSPERPTRPERLCREVAQALGDDGVVVVDTGHAGIWSASMMDLKPTQMFLRCAGTLGWSFPAAIGAKAALPGRTVVCLTGDGGLYYHLAELETAARHDLAVVVVVNNNRSLSQDMRIFRRAWDDVPTPTADRMWMFNNIDLTAVAKSLGCIGIKVEDPKDLQTALHDAVRAEGPVLIDVVTDYNILPERPHGGSDFYLAPPPVQSRSRNLDGERINRT